MGFSISSILQPLATKVTKGESPEGDLTLVPIPALPITPHVGLRQVASPP